MKKRIILPGFFMVVLAFASCGNKSAEQTDNTQANATSNPASQPATDMSNAPFPPKDPAAAPKPAAPATKIEFAKMEHNFGKIKQESENTYEFSFKNTGENPLIITSAKGSCGCTVPEYPTEPVQPGASGKIKVKYSPGQQSGDQEKTVTIEANTDPVQTILKIKAKVG
ncbi:MAG: DUF1573 domain-containing protein [Bacteroidia bacterium]|nr:DUF1573 domain-containing protein [Bacteroidia bacterium]